MSISGVEKDVYKRQAVGDAVEAGQTLATLN